MFSYDKISVFWGLYYESQKNYTKKRTVSSVFRIDDKCVSFGLESLLLILHMKLYTCIYSNIVTFEFDRMRSIYLKRHGCRSMRGYSYEREIVLLGDESAASVKKVFGYFNVRENDPYTPYRSMSILLILEVQSTNIT